MTTTQDRGKSYGNMPTGIPRVLDQHARRLYTSMPGTVVSYDATNRRADVRGSLDVVLADGTQVERPVISNVPVLFPGGANFIFTLSVGGWGFGVVGVLPCAGCQGGS